MSIAKKIIAPLSSAAPAIAPPTLLPTKLAQDDLPHLAQKIENLASEAEALAMVETVLADTAVSRFQLGGILTVMKEKGWHGGCASFFGMIDERFGLGVAAAYKAMMIYRTVVDMGVGLDAIRNLGSTKLTILCEAANQHEWTPEEFSQQLIKSAPLSFRKTEAMLKGPKALPGPAPSETPSPVAMLTPSTPAPAPSSTPLIAAVEAAEANPMPDDDALSGPELSLIKQANFVAGMGGHKRLRCVLGKADCLKGYIVKFEKEK